MPIFRIHQDSPATSGRSGCRRPEEAASGHACFSFRKICLKFLSGQIGLAVLICALSPILFAQQQPDVVSAIEVHGNRSVPAETVRAHIFTRPGDVYDQAAIERDFNSLWNTGYFEDIRFEREATPKGWILHIYVKEKPRVREINYLGINAISKNSSKTKSRSRRSRNTIPPKLRRPKL